MSTTQRPRSRGGFTLVETLITLLIFTLVSGAMAAGIRFGVSQYQQAMRLSEAKMLCSTLSAVIRSELANATKVELDTDGTLLGFFSMNYASKNRYPIFYSVNDDRMEPASDGFGELAIGIHPDGPGNKEDDKLLINSAAYSSYGLKAKAEVRYDRTRHLFAVTLVIRSAQDSNLVESSFDVFPLNALQDEDGNDL